MGAQERKDLCISHSVVHTTLNITPKCPECSSRRMTDNEEQWLLFLGFRELIKVTKPRPRWAVWTLLWFLWALAAQEPCFIMASPLSDLVPVKYLKRKYSTNLCPSQSLLLCVCTVCHFDYAAWEAMRDPWEKHSFCRCHHFQQKGLPIVPTYLSTKVSQNFFLPSKTIKLVLETVHGELSGAAETLVGQAAGWMTVHIYDYLSQATVCITSCLSSGNNIFTILTSDFVILFLLELLQSTTNENLGIIMYCNYAPITVY